MDVKSALMFGAVGGLLVELIAFWTNLSAWQEDRRKARRLRRKLPTWNRYFDLWPDVAVAVTRLSIGAVGGFIFHGQVTSALAAVAVGASAPAMLRQLGSARTVEELPGQGSGEQGGGG